MAEATKTSDESKSQTDPEVDEAEDKETRYETDELIQNARELVGESPAAVAGALASVNRKTHSVAQAKDEVRKFLKRKVGE